MSQPQTPPQKREFRCIHCNGTIAIPFNLPPTTAPCPHCGNAITSPAPEPQQPAQVHQQPAAAPVPSQAPVASPSPAPAAPARIPMAAPPDKSPPATDPPTRKLEPERRSLLAPALLGLLLLAICAGIGLAVIRLRDQQSNILATIPATQTAPSQTPPRRQQNWQTEAYEVLDKFLKGKTVAEKLPFVIPSPGIEERMNDRYAGTVINDIGDSDPDDDDKPADIGNLPEGTPAEGFSTYGSTEEDRARGIYLLSYYRPAHFAIKDFFRPVAPIEVEWGLDDAEPLLALMANAENFTSESLSAMAFFLRTPDGLKIDWDTFYQTKYKTFETFLQAPEPDHTETFRVVMWEDVDGSGKEDLENRTYHIVPPTGPTGGVRIKVPVDSELGRKLSVINWIRAKTLPRQITRTATVELKWVMTDGEPKVVLNRLICWEFLGIGGKPENVAIGPDPGKNSPPQPHDAAPAPVPVPPPASAPPGNGKP